MLDHRDDLAQFLANRGSAEEATYDLTKAIFPSLMKPLTGAGTAQSNEARRDEMLGLFSKTFSSILPIIRKAKPS